MNFNAWLGASSTLLGAPDEATRAAAAWRRISAKPTSVSFIKPASVAANGTVTPETTLAAQVVRVEVDDRAVVIEGAAGSAPLVKLIVFGLKGHATIADTIMEEGYRFRHAGDNYQIYSVIETIGERQGVAVSTG